MIRLNTSPSIDRRTLLVGIAATTIAGSATLAAPQTATEGATKVWLDMDHKALDDAYDQPKYAPNIQQLIKRYASVSDAMRAKVGEPKRVAYGPTEIEKLDVFPPKQANAPIHIHIHGGAWRQRPASDYAFLGEMLIHAGAHYVLPDFISVDESNGELAPMVEQVRRSIAWTVRNAASFGGDPTRVYLSAFSSGSHLAGFALLTDWRKDFDLPDDVIKGAVLERPLRSQGGAPFGAVEIR